MGALDNVQPGQFGAPRGISDGHNVPSPFLNRHGINVSVNTAGQHNVQMVPTHEVARFASQPTTAQHAKEVGTHLAESGSMEPLILQYHPATSEAYLGEGNHRLRAAKALGMSHVPVRVRRNSSGLPGRGALTDSDHPNIATGKHIPADIYPSEIGFSTQEEN